MKLLIDWQINDALTNSKNQKFLRGLLPIHSSGDVFFYSPNLQTLYYDEGRGSKLSKGKYVARPSAEVIVN
jgi:hypothetical protein